MRKSLIVKGSASWVAGSAIPGAIFALAMSFLAGIGPAGAQEKASLTVAMALTPLSAPIIIAKNKRYFAANGLDVTVNDFIGGHRAIKAMFDGKADIATSSEVVVMFNSMTRSDFSITGTFVTSDNDAKIVSRKETGIQVVNDLAGKWVGTVTGASAQFFLDQELLFAGVDASKVNIVHMSPEDAPSLLASKKVDAIAVWEPYAYLTTKKLGNQAVIIPNDKAYTETFNAIALNSFLASNPATLEKFLRALIQATDFINDNPDQSQLIVAQRLNKDLEFIEFIWSDFNFSISLHQWLITTLESQARWAIAGGHVEQKKVPNYLDYLYLDALDRLKPEAITVIR